MAVSELMAIAEVDLDFPRFRGHMNNGGVPPEGVSTMPKRHPPYPAEFRAEAVRLVREGGVPITRVAADLGVTGESIRNWVQQAEIDEGVREGTTSEEAILRASTLGEKVRRQRDLVARPHDPRKRAEGTLRIQGWFRDRHTPELTVNEAGSTARPRCRMYTSVVRRLGGRAGATLT